MNKKIISFTISLILCLTILAVLPVFAASNKGISSSGETVERGGNIVVILKIGTQTKAVSDLSLKFTFDNSAFELIDYNIPEIIGAEKSISDSQKSNHITASNTNGSVAFGYNSEDGEASVTLGDVSVSFTFKAKEEATLGSYYFTIIDYDICSLDKSGLPLAICDVSSLTESEKNARVEIKAYTATETSVKLNKNTLTINEGEKETLVATVSGSSASKTVTWKSDNESVATVDSSGNVKAVKKGIATITATSNGKKDTCTVTVNCAHDFIEKADLQYLVSSATCKSAAVYYKSCSKCGEKGIAKFKSGDKDLSNHIGDTEVRNKKDATCYSEGYTGDTYCLACENIITAGEKIEKTNHTESSNWEQDDTNHWKMCTADECGAILEKAEHTASDWIVDKEATESAEGSKHKECTVCGKVLETEKIEKTSSDTDKDTDKDTDESADKEPDNYKDKDSDKEPDKGSDKSGKGSIVIWIVIAAIVVVIAIVVTIIIVRKKKSGK